MKTKTIQLLVRFVLLILLGITHPSIASGQASLNDCDTVKSICYSDYALLLEYAQKGLNHDSIVIELRGIIINLEDQNEISEKQIKLVQKEADFVKIYAKELEKELAKKQRNNKILASTSSILGGLLVVLFVGL